MNRRYLKWIGASTILRLGLRMQLAARDFAEHGFVESRADGCERRNGLGQKTCTDAMEAKAVYRIES